MTIPSSRAKASPINHVRPGGPPCVILYGDRDAELIAEGSKRLAEKLAGAAVDVQLVVAEGQDHAYDLRATDLDPVMEPVVRFLSKQFDMGMPEEEQTRR